MDDKKGLPFRDNSWRERRRDPKTTFTRQKTIKQICAAEAASGNPYNYQSVEAPPSTRPIIKYCDITGYPVIPSLTKEQVPRPSERVDLLRQGGVLLHKAAEQAYDRELPIYPEAAKS